MLTPTPPVRCRAGLILLRVPARGGGPPRPHHGPIRRPPMIHFYIVMATLVGGLLSVAVAALLTV